MSLNFISVRNLVSFWFVTPTQYVYPSMLSVLPTHYSVAISVVSSTVEGIASACVHGTLALLNGPRVQE
jgi:hypothetical protein